MARKSDDPAPVALGFRAQRGGALMVAVALDGTEPRVVLSTLLPTAEDGDRLAREPYHVAAEMMAAGGEVPPEAAAAVAEGRRRQDALAAKGLAGFLQRLRDSGCEPRLAALLVNRAGWITDLLSYSLGAPEHPPVAENLAVREAVRSASAACGLNLIEVDEKSLPETAPVSLGLAAADMDRTLAGLGASAGKPWRKEQKLAALAAWVALAGG